MKIEIHEEKNCAWCELNGTFIYGKNVGEVRTVLDNLALNGMKTETMQ